jgi:hypothetical protein
VPFGSQKPLFGRLRVDEFSSPLLVGSRSSWKKASQITCRTSRPTDIAGIAKFLTDTFEEDIPSWNVLQLVKMDINNNNDNNWKNE